jgi:hypothetical protein
VPLKVFLKSNGNPLEIGWSPAGGAWTAERCRRGQPFDNGADHQSRHHHHHPISNAGWRAAARLRRPGANSQHRRNASRQGG